MLKWLKRAAGMTSATDNTAVSPTLTGVWRAFMPEGLDLGTFEAVGTRAGATLLSAPTLPAFITQLHDEGYASGTEDTAHLPWASLYSLLDEPVFQRSLPQLELPPFCNAVPELKSHHSLTDADFSIHVASWRDEAGRSLAGAEQSGGVIMIDGKAHLLSLAGWKTAQQVMQFQARPATERNESAHRLAWGQIRRSALAANARLDLFLYQSVVLTPETLAITMRKSDVGGTRVVEIMPGFKGAPPNWLDIFDSYRNIPPRYDINTPEGVVQVVITAEMRAALQTIRNMEGRRVAGSRAEAFLVNPRATLGVDVASVIDETQFEQARIDANIFFDHFTAIVRRDAFGYPETVGLSVESPGTAGQVTAEERLFSDDEQLDGFITGLNGAIVKQRQLYAWAGFEFELLGDSPDQLQALNDALEERRQPRILVRYTEIYDLNAYTSRVEDIGVDRPYYSPYIAKKGDEWWPENLVNMVVYTPDGDTEPVAVPLSDDVQNLLRTKVEEAQATGKTSVELPGLPKPIPINDAKDLLDVYRKVRSDAQKNRDDGVTGGEKENTVKAGKGKQLLIKSNIDTVDYEEIRRDILTTYSKEPRLPTGFKSTTNLLQHQNEGVAWLQHLFSHAPNHCRGAIFADDMGLGKTLQLLTFIARAFEEDPNLPPALIVAPVSLLENWAEEIAKFFSEGTFRPLIAYGDNLSNLRVPRSAIDAQLRDENLLRFLKPGWVGDANIVLTNYETLRDLEFSFAAQKWSIMACDESQKIKNPNAMMTRAAKKQNVLFKVVCTGTPVENTLIDLWCLFDLVQAGLLGALNEFGKRYRKPIEAETKEEEARVKELQQLIDPQILRRMKTKVAKLPLKHVKPCLIPMSNLQRTYYTNAVNSFKQSQDKSRETPMPSPFKNHLGLLQYLRSICTTPHAPGQGRFKPVPLAQFRIEAPKAGWLLDTLEQVRMQDEKAIVFAEFRDTQQMLAYFINEQFGFSPDIINGDVEASSKHIASRQKRIKAFQAKPGFGVIILSPVAVGYGVNVQEANHVIHYTRTWNPAKEDQATDRAYRIGQKREVHVYLPITSAADFKTFDVRLHELLEEKRELADNMLNGSGSVTPADWNVQDIVPDGSNDPVFASKVTLDEVVRMEWDWFEALIAAIWQKKGYKTVYRTPRQDEGVDVVAFTGTKGDLVQCKSSGADNASLDSQGVKDVLLGRAQYEARHPQVDFSLWAVTNQFFNDSTCERARNSKVSLVNQRDIEELLEKYPVTNADLQRFLYVFWEEAA
ncbi:helicase SNF2 [Caballeronia calidae]|uniref:Helicase SNF2 n=1 Tax=Caballeronia calidae TaxID=1777139 RepID=A0A158BA23_9BURK|nr:SNF2-related protein [Caballeronia calidae]SAK66636.1 helicase SNF2 [Caballeronia calidae]